MKTNNATTLTQKDREAISKTIREGGNSLIQAVKEEVFLCEISADLDRFDRLLHLFGCHLNYELIKDFRDKGLGEDLTKLADKAGRIQK
jgi:hypothetical protein